MFCVYRVRGFTTTNEWVAEYIEAGKLKISCKAKTPIESIERLFSMIAGEDDETGTYAEIDGKKSLCESNSCKPTDVT